MASVGTFEAKTHLSDLLDRVARGEKITITRHGVPAALLVLSRKKRRNSRTRKSWKECGRFAKGSSPAR